MCLVWSIQFFGLTIFVILADSQFNMPRTKMETPEGDSAVLHTVPGGFFILKGTAEMPFNQDSNVEFIVDADKIGEGEIQ